MVEERVEKGGVAAKIVRLAPNARATPQFWVGRGCRSPTWQVSGLPQSPPVCFRFAGNGHTDWSAEKCGTPLDGLRRPDSSVRMLARGLAVGVEDAL